MRTLLAAVAAFFLVAVGAQAQQKEPCAVAGNNNVFLGIETVDLWPGAVPEAKGTRCEDRPTLTIVSPRPGHETGSAVVILPGGAYAVLAADLEGREIADWFAARGFKAYILSYRLSSNGYLLPVPLLDARRAVQTVRSRAAQDKVDPKKVAIIGFSAGGHLAALAATQPVEAKADAVDPVERFSSRPDYLILGYPWIGAISSDTTNLSYCKLFNVMDRCEELRKAYSPDLYVSAKTPPTFLFHTFADGTVPIEQGMRFLNALVKAGVPTEAHILARGPHGVGLGRGDESLDQWPASLEIWLRAQGLLQPVR